MLTINDLHDYQKYVIATAIQKKRCAVFLGTGLGKTIISLTTIDQLLKRKWIRGALVVTTKKAMYNTWRQEALKWAHTRYLKISIIHGDAICGNADYAKRRQLCTPSHIHLINYEGLVWLAKTLHNKQFPWDCVFYDESTKIKHTNTQRFKAWGPYMKKCIYRYPMTGTPLPNGLMDLYGQMYTVDLGLRLGSTITSYRERFFRNCFRGSYADYKPIKGAKKAIAKRIKDATINMRKEDYIKLPSITYNPIELDLPTSLQEQYEELETQFFLDLEEAKVEAFSSAALSMKLRQFIQGNVYTGIGKERKTHRVHTEKLDMLSEIMEGIGNCIVAYNFQFERDDLQSVFKDAPAIEGRTPAKLTNMYIEQWKRRQLKVLLCNPASDLHGLNLQTGGHHMLWYGLTWNLEHYVQLIDRLWRQGQKNKVFIHHMLFRNTVDMVLYETLKQKGATQATLLNNLKQYRRTKV